MWNCEEPMSQQLHRPLYKLTTWRYNNAVPVSVFVWLSTSFYNGIMYFKFLIIIALVAALCITNASVNGCRGNYYSYVAYIYLKYL